MEILKTLKSYTQDEKKVLYFVALTWGIGVLIYVRAVVMKFIPPLRVIDSIFIGAIIFISLLFTIGSVLKRIKLRDILFYIACCTFYLLSFIVFPANFHWLEFFLPIVFFQTLPFFFVGLLVDAKKHIDFIEYVSMAFIVLSLLYLYFTFDHREIDEEEMGAAYALLPHLLVVLYATFRKFRWYTLLLFIVGLIRLTGTGNRGSLLCVVVFLALYLILNVPRKVKVIVSLFLVAFAFFIIPRFESILFAYSDFLGDFGFNARVFNMVLNGDMIDANGRDSLADFFINRIHEGGFMGYGLFGDRTLLNREDGYPHNLALEFLIDYGVLVGTVLLLVIAIYLVLAYKACKDKESKTFLLILFIVGCFSLFLSDSYLMNPMFFLLIGYLVRLVRDNSGLNKLSLK